MGLQSSTEKRRRDPLDEVIGSRGLPRREETEETRHKTGTPLDTTTGMPAPAPPARLHRRSTRSARADKTALVQRAPRTCWATSSNTTSGAMSQRLSWNRREGGPANSWNNAHSRRWHSEGLEFNAANVHAGECRRTKQWFQGGGVKRRQEGGGSRYVLQRPDENLARTS